MQSQVDGGDASRSELAAELIRSLGELRIRVTGSSMLPAIRPGDVLLIHRCPIQQAHPGDVVFFARYGRLFAHRVVSNSGVSLLTQGDAITEPDPPVAAQEMLGKAVRLVRGTRTIGVSAKPSLPARLAAALFRHSACAGRVFTRVQGLRGRACA